MSSYFESYGDINTHRLMLQDVPRTNAYKETFEALREEDIRGKVVLDVGAGTGILSLFAAKCGARKVYAVEASNIAAHTQQLVEENGFQDVIQVMQSKVEDAVLEEKVDIIVSEWMGFYLLHESMLKSVLAARDKWLKPGGIMLPRHAKLYCSPVSLEDYCNERFGFWTDVYGFSMNTFISAEVQSMLSAPIVTQLKGDALLAKPALVKSIDCLKAKQEEVEHIQADLKFMATKSGICHGFCFWFDCHFENGVTLRTSPMTPETHWKQSIVMLPEMLAAAPNLRLDCRVTFHPAADNDRHYEISLEM